MKRKQAPANGGGGRDVGRRGVAVVYILLLLPLLVGFVSLSVDVNRVRVAKAELSTAADAAARYGASFIPNGAAAVQNAAVTTAAANLVDGSPLVLDPNNDITVGTWDLNARAFTAGGATPNAVRIKAQRTTARGNPITLFFARTIGMSTCDIHSTCYAVLSAGSASYTTRTDGIMNLYLAGMPDGAYGGGVVSGTAPTNSPVQVAGLTLAAGQVLKFAATGSTADDPVNINQNWTPDGQPGGLRTNDSGYLNGMAQLTAQQGSLIGVFLTDNPPTTGSTPPALTFATQADMDYTTISPQLKQPFFIGDGKTSGGVQQQVVVPAGATRLYLGTHDNINWANNSGYFMVSVNGTAPKISFGK